MQQIELMLNLACPLWSVDAWNNCFFCTERAGGHAKYIFEHWRVILHYILL